MGGVRDQDEDAAWREIVENYGERATLDEGAPDPGDDPERPVDPDAAPTDGPVEPDEPGEPAEPPVPGGPHASYVADVPDPSPYLDAPEERYVPPPPPPLPRPRGVRGLAWLGLFGSPLVLLVAVVAGIGLPRLVTWALVAGFVAGFAHLVWTMPRGPRDPFDDGAQV